jgi:ADP-ribose pyrophosphatase YjhB (NUDIX family)
MSPLSPELQKILASELKNSLPQLSTNVALFRYANGQLEVATVDFVFAPFSVIPGGFVYEDENVSDAAKRVIIAQTSVTDILIREVGVFGNARRSFKENFLPFEKAGVSLDVMHKLEQRYVSIAYYGIFDDRKIQGIQHPLFTEVSWLPLSDIDCLRLDHTEIVLAAMQKIRLDVLSQPILQGFMPTHFTIPQLLSLYMAIYERPIDRGNFRQRILKSGILQKVGQTAKQGSGRPADLYQFHPEYYPNSLNTGVKLGF